jgi:hypothetical protein
MPIERINTTFNSVPHGMMRNFSLTAGRSAEKEIFQTFTDNQSRVGLWGLGSPADLKVLEIGCNSLDVGKAAALAGIRSLDINSIDPESLQVISNWLAKAGLLVNTFPEEIQQIFFDQDYDMFIACRLVQYFSCMGIDTFARLIHGNAQSRRPKRIYFFEKKERYKVNLPFFASLHDAGFKLIETRLSPKFYSVVAEMTAIPGAVKIAESAYPGIAELLDYDT